MANQDSETPAELAQLKAEFEEYKVQTGAKISGLEEKIRKLEFELPMKVQQDINSARARAAGL